MSFRHAKGDNGTTESVAEGDLSDDMDSPPPTAKVDLSNYFTKSDVM